MLALSGWIVVKSVMIPPAAPPLLLRNIRAAASRSKDFLDLDDHMLAVAVENINRPVLAYFGRIPALDHHPVAAGPAAVDDQVKRQLGRIGSRWIPDLEPSGPRTAIEMIFAADAQRLRTHDRLEVRDRFPGAEGPGVLVHCSLL